LGVGTWSGLGSMCSARTSGDLAWTWTSCSQRCLAEPGTVSISLSDFPFPGQFGKPRKGHNTTQRGPHSPIVPYRRYTGEHGATGVSSYSLHILNKRRSSHFGSLRKKRRRGAIAGDLDFFASASSIIACAVNYWPRLSSTPPTCPVVACWLC